jgi:prepilin-type N-terminal cleavage/methylation domain-containing protein
MCFSIKYYNIFRYPRYRGFTLIEMIVSIAIFSTVVLVAVGALLSIISANRKANALRVVMENLNFAVESVARDIRTGNEYSCGGTGDCSGAHTLSFLDQDGNSAIYSFSDSSLIRTNDSGSMSITSPAVIIENVTFSVVGSSPGDELQPRVLMTIEGYAGYQGSTKSAFSIQTTISQRDSDS